jgi:predicted nucleic acid-binding protein
MNDGIFLDSNILIYAHDEDGGEKFHRASQWIQAFWVKGTLPNISIQVLQEFYTVMLRKNADARVYREVVEHYLKLWPVVENTRELMRQAFDIQQRFQLSFWDANIVAAAQQSGASELWTEDLNEGQDYGGVRVVNPFQK